MKCLFLQRNEVKTNKIFKRISFSFLAKFFHFRGNGGKCLYFSSLNIRGIKILEENRKQLLIFRRLWRIHGTRNNEGDDTLPSSIAICLLGWEASKEYFLIACFDYVHKIGRRRQEGNDKNSTTVKIAVFLCQGICHYKV